MSTRLFEAIQEEERRGRRKDGHPTSVICTRRSDLVLPAGTDASIRPISAVIARARSSGRFKVGLDRKEKERKSGCGCGCTLGSLSSFFSIHFLRLFSLFGCTFSTLSSTMTQVRPNAPSTHWMKTTNRH